jgi:hypothetical protein
MSQVHRRDDVGSCVAAAVVLIRDIVVWSMTVLGYRLEQCTPELLLLGYSPRVKLLNCHVCAITCKGVLSASGSLMLFEHDSRDTRGLRVVWV